MTTFEKGRYQVKTLEYTFEQFKNGLPHCNTAMPKILL